MLSTPEAQSSERFAFERGREAECAGSVVKLRDDAKHHTSSTNRTAPAAR
jgi:hypothetical protein